jgi:hypothetical protein
MDLHGVGKSIGCAIVFATGSLLGTRRSLCGMYAPDSLAGAGKCGIWSLESLSSGSPCFERGASTSFEERSVQDAEQHGPAPSESES